MTCLFLGLLTCAYNSINKNCRKPDLRKGNKGDNAGNQSSKSVAFNIIVTADSLSDVIDTLLASGEIDNGGVANSLTQQLENGNIDALLHHIDSQDGKHIFGYATELLRTAIASLT